MADTKLYEYIPTMEMRRFVQTLLSEEVKGNKTEAERRTGVRRQLFYWHFNRSAEFRKWFSEQCEKFLSINETIPSYMLMRKILDGDVQAIRTYYELKSKLGNKFVLDQSKHYHITNFKEFVEDAYRHNRKGKEDTSRLSI